MAPIATLPQCWCQCANCVIAAGAREAVERISPSRIRVHTRPELGLCHDAKIDPRDSGLHAPQASLPL